MPTASTSKRSQGQYFTTFNPFDHPGFLEWAKLCNLRQQTILEPFAGSNNLIQMLVDLELCISHKSYDIEPQMRTIEKRDTLHDFPSDFSVCITNPPYIAKNSATRRMLPYPDTHFADLYLFALDLCLKHCDFVAAIIPASFINSELFRDRLHSYILLENRMFVDTDCPVCLALFIPKSSDIMIYTSDFSGLYSELEKKLPKVIHEYKLVFNAPEGELGLIAIDDIYKPSIRFVHGNEIPAKSVKYSSRSITRIAGVSSRYVDALNNRLKVFRAETHDIFLTPFKGLRKDGRYRRRLHFSLASRLINEVVY
jgi:hypothetical protein